MKNKKYKDRRKQIGYLLQHERKCQKLEQEQVAMVMDVRQEYVSRIEVGTRRIDILELIDYCEALGYTLTEFAWKIETYLSALSLLPLPKRNILNKKIQVNVSLRDNKFSASFEYTFPGTPVFTADTFANLLKKMDEELISCIKAIVADSNNVPSWLENKEYEFEYKFHDVRSLLNAYSPYISLAAISRVSDINQNLLSQYANGMKKARPNQVKRIMEAIHIIGKQLVAAAE